MNYKSGVSGLATLFGESCSECGPGSKLSVVCPECGWCVILARVIGGVKVWPCACSWWLKSGLFEVPRA